MPSKLVISNNGNRFTVTYPDTLTPREMQNYIEEMTSKDSLSFTSDAGEEVRMFKGAIMSSVFTFTHEEDPYEEINKLIRKFKTQAARNEEDRFLFNTDATNITKLRNCLKKGKLKEALEMYYGFDHTLQHEIKTNAPSFFSHLMTV